MGRVPLFAGNWKMHETVSEAWTLVCDLKSRLAGLEGAEVAVCPPFTALCRVAKAVAESSIALGAQDVFWEEQGAFTGMISPAMLQDVGCRYVIIGHSERRGRFGKADPSCAPELLRVFGDTDASVNRKSHAALAHALTPIVCVGETLPERRAGDTDPVISGQVRAALEGIAAEQVAGLVIAYEPVWAIGTGQVCDPPEANRVIGEIRGGVRGLVGEGPASRVRILYGGSVTESNVADIMAQSEIDGALVGGASLKADVFAALVRSGAVSAASRL